MKTCKKQLPAWSYELAKIRKGMTIVSAYPTELHEHLLLLSRFNNSY